MSEKDALPQLDLRSPWVLDVRELGRRAGQSQRVQRQIPVTEPLGLPDVVVVPSQAEIKANLLLESVVEGVLLTGTASAPVTAECSRCLDPITGEVSVELTELFAYPGSATEETTEEDEIESLVDDKINLEPTIRDAVVLALPQAPLCTEDCAGLCTECGIKWADLEPGHRHEIIDPRWAALVERFDETPASGPEELDK